MIARDLSAWLKSRNAEMYSLPHPRMVVIQVRSLDDPRDRVTVHHHDAETAIELAAMVYDLPESIRRQIGEQPVGLC